MTHTSLAFPSLLRSRFIGWALLAVAAAEVFSYAGYVYPQFGRAVWLIVTVGVFLVSVRRLDIGLWCIVAELAIGSKGYLFQMTIAGMPISIRVSLFAAVLAAWGLAFLRRRVPTRELLHDARWYIPVIAVIAWGIVLGLAQGRSPRLLFLDANGYLFFGLVPVYLTVLRSRHALRRILQVLIAATAVSSALTVLLLYAFSHQFPDVVPGLYRWIRDTGVGEITLLNGNLYRIFFQSHLYAIAALLIGICALPWSRAVPPRRDLRQWTYLLSASVVFLVGLSRSFWVGGGVAVIVVVLLLRRRIGYEWKVIGRWLLSVIGVGAGAVLIASLAVIVPVPASTPGASPAVFAERVGDLTTEAAAVSRWQLAVPLVKAIAASPVFGSGFGTTVTYRSADPRIVAATGGAYTTYAFEWGYLDLWLKVGVMGVAFYGFLLWTIARDALRLLRDPASAGDRAIVIGMFAVLAFLIVTHGVSPYLNHPLGIGLVMLIGTTFRTLVRQSETP